MGGVWSAYGRVQGIFKLYGHISVCLRACLHICLSLFFSLPLSDWSLFGFLTGQHLEYDSEASGLKMTSLLHQHLVNCMLKYDSEADD